jgi:PHD/YefM family antitoxin component YafN of YafNO toxin-antitoxin module
VALKNHIVKIVNIMKITATDFQLRVNEYFTKIVKGERVVIERYGKEFAVLLSFDDYQRLLAKSETNTNDVNTSTAKVNYQVSDSEVTPAATDELTPSELKKLIKLLLKRD